MEQNKRRELRFSIVLPCYNEAQSIPLLLKRYRDVWEDLPGELILVNNGSTDETTLVLEEELKKSENRFFRIVTVPVNQGYGYGIMQGLKEAGGEIIGFSHADMQCDAGDLFRAYHELMKHQDREKVLIKGKRGMRDLNASILTGGMTLFSSFFLRMPLDDINAQPKVFHHKMLDNLIDPPMGFELDLYFLYRARKTGMKIKTIPVVFGERAYGQSRWAFSFLSRYKTILGFMKYIVKLSFGILK